MSGDQVPYHLRPNKHIDRRVFIEFLNQLGAVRPLSSYGYVSMGGPYLEDAKEVYLGAGICNITSLEEDDHVLKRQEFNKPYDFIRCTPWNTKKFIDGFTGFATEGDCDNFIVWLDYTDPKKRLSQLQEFESLVAQADSGDVIRITMNANPSTLADSFKGFSSLREKRLNVLRSQIGEYQNGAKLEDMDGTGLPIVLARAVGLAAQKGRTGKRSEAHPISTFSYNDGSHTMITVTTIIMKRSEWDEFRQKAPISSWPYLANSWDDITTINVPSLSSREKSYIDRMILTETPSRIHENLGFMFSDDEKESTEKISQYVHFHRYYPNFSKVES